MESFSTLKNICAADEATLHLCPGLGDKKVRKLYQALHQPFQKGGSKKKCKPEEVIDSSKEVIELDQEES